MPSRPNPNPDQPATDLAGLREAAAHVVKQLSDAGHVAYFAGGCVRDRLMGLEPDDYDIATDATPDQVSGVFPRVHTVGKSFGVMLVKLRGFEIQVATFRTEGVYSDGRRPDSVTFSDARHDASRRDFTINGLFENPLNGEVIDYVGGRADLEARIIRAIGDPQARLREDRLRMLRAVRFAARFGFAIEPETADAIRAGASELRGVSRERIGEEVRRMLSDPNRAVAAWEMQYLGLDSTVLAEPHQQVAPTRVGRLPDYAAFPTALAAWLVDRHCNDDQEVCSRIASRWADVLMLSNEDRFAVIRCLEVYQILGSTWTQLGVAAQKRLAASPEFDEGVLLLQATDRQAFVDVRRRTIELAQSGLAPTALLDGSDLIAMGLKPGPTFSRILEAVYDAQLEGSLRDKGEAVAMASAIASTMKRSR
jgi:poly(A) polymerase